MKTLLLLIVLLSCTAPALASTIIGPDGGIWTCNGNICVGPNGQIVTIAR